MENPFICGDPVLPDNHIGRDDEIRRLVGRIRQGASSIIVGDPRVGKTSLLQYLAAPEKYNSLYGEAVPKLWFQYLDAHTFGENFEPAHFWQRAIEPMCKQIFATAQPRESSSFTQNLNRTLEFAKRALAVLEEQAAGYTVLSIPAHLKLELEDKRKEVAKLEIDSKSTNLPSDCAQVEQLQILKTNSNLPVVCAYRKCKDEKFADGAELEEFFKQLDASGWRLVLLLDEFDVVLEHSRLNNIGFLGDFRSFASRHTSLAYLIAARQSLTQLNAKTKGYTNGSPYFNTPEPIILEPFSDKDCAELLEWGGKRFTAADRRYLVELTGKYPYFLQVAASELWEAYTEMPDDVDRRWRQVESKLYESVAFMFSNMWDLWTPEMRMAFMAAALPQIRLNMKLREQNLIREIKYLGKELRELASRGLIVEGTLSDSQWHVRSSVLLWWLADQIAQEVRDEMSCKEWLQKQQIEGFLTREQKKKWGEALRSVGEVLKDGAKTLIEATAKGFAEAVTK